MMNDFVRGNCHKCKFETTAECISRSQKMGFPNCYQSTTTNADRIRKMTIEELAEFIGCDPLHDICPNNCNDDWDKPCKVCVLDWLKQESE